MLESRVLVRRSCLSICKEELGFFEIDLGAASKVPGFVLFVSHNDIPGSNATGDVFHDEEVFVSSITPCVGSIIGVVLCAE